MLLRNRLYAGIVNVPEHGVRASMHESAHDERNGAAALLVL
jgi:hypothetical protein